MGGGGSSPARLPATGTTETTSLEDTSFKTVRLSNEERKEKIHRYIKKRNERNFSKKIKVRQELPNYSNSNSKYHPPPPQPIFQTNFTSPPTTLLTSQIFFFKKNLQYACRKTLADSRPRVRGRFAKNDDYCEASRSIGSQNHEEYEQIVSIQMPRTPSKKSLKQSDIIGLKLGIIFTK